MAKNGIVSGLQICYYDGERIENEPENCIHVPFNSIVDYFIKTKNRFPSLINSDNTNLSTTELSELQDEFKKSMNKVQNILDNKIINIKKEIQKLKPNFNDEKLRIFAYGCRETVLIKHLVKNILIAADELGYETYLHTQDNDMESCNEVFYLKALRDFNPHITINVNHLNNDFISDEVFNFIWFQDYMPLLRKESPPIHLRDRDIVYFLTEHLGKLLREKDIPSKYQSFCIDTNIYKKRSNIERIKKIVFIGSSYLERYESVITPDKEIACKELFELNIKYGYEAIGINKSEYLAEKYNISEKDISSLRGYIQRDLLLKYIINLNLDYEIEVYGYGWEYDKDIFKHYKGHLAYGEDISKVYNSAVYGLVVGGYVMQQRTLESAASGAIPLVFDARESGADLNHKCFEDSLLFFKRPDDLRILLSQVHNKDLDCIVNENSYKQFVEKMVGLVKKELNEQL
ncbi:hypothetical protein FJR48_00835 [Sulfurimonas lithotrophica]|uniref:Glycosyltransferase family 1 protein n=1 Tax=Sulfurimonas lithotrophica TaxID=2590022 RepID=A0A5P8NY63_9BACT|nr:hypothetical protein [Sulfurimonas lithotrophica]QFR48346.1 hypothetical protein FJR48_00835 [Sulfurimonas lithotrophica]